MIYHLCKKDNKECDLHPTARDCRYYFLVPEKCKNLYLKNKFIEGGEDYDKGSQQH